jgi:hypothetical protein
VVWVETTTQYVFFTLRSPFMPPFGWRVKGGTEPKHRQLSLAGLGEIVVPLQMDG